MQVSNYNAPFLQKMHDTLTDACTLASQEINRNEQLSSKAKDKVFCCLKQLTGISENNESPLKELDNIISDLRKPDERLVKSGNPDKIRQLAERKHEASYLLNTLKFNTDPRSLDFNAQLRLKKAVALIDQNAIVDTESGSTLISLCAISEDPFFRGLVKTCLENGANPNSKNKADITPLYCMCQYDELKLALALREAGADLNIIAKNSKTPLDIAFEKNSYDIIWVLQDEGLPPEYTWGDDKLFLIEILKKITSFGKGVLFSQQQLRKFALANPDKLRSLGHKQKEIDALLTIALEKQDIPLVKLLVAGGAQLSHSKEENRAIEQICAALDPPQNWTLADIAFVEKLANLQMLHAITTPSGEMMLNLALQNMKLYPTVVETYKLSMDTLTDLEDLCLLNTRYSLTDDLASQKEIHSQRKNIVKQLQAFDLQSYHDYLKNETDALEKRESAAIDWIKTQEKNQDPIKLKSDLIPTKEVTATRQYSTIDDICSLCIAQEKYDLFPFALSHFYTYEPFRLFDKAKLHFLLDKVNKSLNLKKYEGGFIKDQALILMEAVSAVAAAFKKRDRKASLEELAVIKLYDQLKQSLSLCAKWDTKKVSQMRAYAQEIVTLLKSKKLDFPLLIPTGRKRHGVVITVDIQPNGKYRLILSNTGNGLDEYHYKSEDGKKYQTSLIIEDVDEMLLFDASVWEEILACKCRENTIDKLYELFGKFGKILPASTNPLNYEQPQMRGTCSAQCLLAAARELIINRIPGTDIAKIAGYKIFKALTITHIGEQDLEKADNFIQTNVKVKLNKLHTRLIQSQIAVDSDTFHSYLATLKKIVKDIGLDDLFAFSTSLPTKTAFERTYLLKTCYDKVRLQCAKDPTFFAAFTSHPKADELLLCHKAVETDRK